MATFTCRVCRHEQTIYWGGGFFTYNRNNLADRIRDPELSRDVRLILQQEDAVVERVVKMAYYCPLCHIWYNFLDFSIITRGIVHTPRYRCEKCHQRNILRPVPFENYIDSPWECEKCRSCNEKMTSVGHWD
ncbi:MAG: hypothetical protein GX937_01925 [Lentisphaerae bacterium]|nr:hypothetical protein [Lentisphaerota bacterium]